MIYEKLNTLGPSINDVYHCCSCSLHEMLSLLLVLQWVFVKSCQPREVACLKYYFNFHVCLSIRKERNVILPTQIGSPHSSRGARQYPPSGYFLVCNNAMNDNFQFQHISTKQLLLVTFCDKTAVIGVRFRTHGTQNTRDGRTDGQMDGQTDVEVKIVIQICRKNNSVSK